jgi:nucleoside-diphosphate-sugar epimerase
VYDRFVVLFESHFKRNYIHVRDIARVFMHGMAQFESMRGQIFNVGLSDANVSKWELCERIKAQLPRFVFVEEKLAQDPDQRNYIVSNEKVERTGFMPSVSLDQGIAELIKGYTLVKNTKYGNV